MSSLFFIFYFLFFLFGLCIGSFLNAVIWRLETGESVIFRKKSFFPSDEGRCPAVLRGGGVLNGKKCILTTPPPVEGRGPNGALRPAPSSTKERRISTLSRSYCPKCRKQLKWHDLVPVFSFLFLRGKCRHCGEKINIQYPLVEIATGILFLLIFNFAGAGTELVPFRILNQFLITQLLNGHWSLVIGHFISLIYWLYIASILIIIFIYDLKHYIIPDKILFPAIGVALLYRVSEFFLAFDFAALRSGNKILFPELVEGFSLVSPYFIAAIIASVFFLSLVFASRGRAMGLGDVKMAFLMGLILGWPDILVALFLSFLSGAVVGLALIFLGKKTMKSQVPFGPFLIIGTFAALFWSGQIIDWYLHLLF